MTTKEENDLIGEFVEALSSRVYKRGYNDGYKNGIVVKNINDSTFANAKKIQEAYENGLNDVWEYVEKLGQLTIKEIYEVFGVEYDNIYGIIADYTPSEFIKAIKAYEEQENEIHVGDEVVSIYGNRGYVTCITEDELCVLYPDGTVGHSTATTYTKTGRHFPQIVEILEQLKGDR